MHIICDEEKYTPLRTKKPPTEDSYILAALVDAPNNNPFAFEHMVYG